MYIFVYTCIATLEPDLYFQWSFWLKPLPLEVLTSNKCYQHFIAPSRAATKRDKKAMPSDGGDPAAAPVPSSLLSPLPPRAIFTIQEAGRNVSPVTSVGVKFGDDAGCGRDDF